MKHNYNTDIRKEFRRLKRNDDVMNGTYEIRNAHFRVNEPTIFGGINEEYIAAELEWYNSQMLSVDALAMIYGKRVKIWDNVADDNMFINSNYGWLIYSKENGYQYEHVKATLKDDPQSRQAVMVYTRPSIHVDAFRNGRHDFICTNTVQYFLRDNRLTCQVNMRSNDAIFGFNNDCAWQKHVLHKLADDLDVEPGPMTWSVGSLHVYERHWHLIK